MTIEEKIEKLKSLRDKLEHRDDISKKEYKDLKQFYDINIEYWEEVLLYPIEEE